MRIDFMTGLRMTAENLGIRGHQSGPLSGMPAGGMEGFEVLLTCFEFSLDFSFGGGTPVRWGPTE
jgi:hypothetical protein